VENINEIVLTISRKNMYPNIEKNKRMKKEKIICLHLVRVNWGLCRIELNEIHNILVWQTLMRFC